MVQFIKVRRDKLEEAKWYLGCPNPDCNKWTARRTERTITLDAPASDWVTDGEYKCLRCKEVYPIENGVPYFFKKGNGIEWQQSTEEKIVESIRQSLNNRDLTWAKIIALSGFFLNKFGNRKKAIDSIFSVVEKVIENSAIGSFEDYVVLDPILGNLVPKEATNNNRDVGAFLMQAATAARYDIEVYRGTFRLPKSFLKTLKEENIANRGIVVEGACATGECLLEIARDFRSTFCIGVDISGTLARRAQRKAGDKTLFVQGDICSLPILDGEAGLYILNNVFDRVAEPEQACSEARRVVLDFPPGRVQTLGYVVFSNCDPLQYDYVTESGMKISFVSQDKRMSLEEAVNRAGFSVIKREQGLWKVNTVAYGKEKLPYLSLFGVGMSVESWDRDISRIRRYFTLCNDNGLEWVPNETFSKEIANKVRARWLKNDSSANK